MARAARRKRTARAAGSERESVRPTGAGGSEEERARQARRRGWNERSFWGWIGEEPGAPFWGTIGGESGSPFYPRPGGGAGPADAAAGPADAAAALSQAMMMAAFAPASAMFAANHADALMFYNAVANQQKTNILGMSVTAKCVRYMFEVGEGSDDDDFDIVEQALGGQ